MGLQTSRTGEEVGPNTRSSLQCVRGVLGSLQSRASRLHMPGSLCLKYFPRCFASSEERVPIGRAPRSMGITRILKGVQPLL